jgi:hypothetical protein
MGSEAIFWLGKCRMDPVGSRQGPVADSHIRVHDDETSGSGATKRVSPVKCWVRCQAKTKSFIFKIFGAINNLFS